MKKRKKKKARRRQGGAVALVCLGALFCLGLGLCQVDERIRAVTMSQTPPLLGLAPESAQRFRVTLLGQEYRLDLAPVRALEEEALRVLATPPAPVRLLWMLAQGLWGG